MDLTRFVAGGMLSHVKRDLVAVIKIIEIHTLLHVSKREHKCLSAAPAYE